MSMSEKLSEFSIEELREMLRELKKTEKELKIALIETQIDIEVIEKEIPKIIDKRIKEDQERLAKRES